MNIAPDNMPPLPPLGQMPSRPRKILIVKPSSLGDVVTAMPVLRGLRRTLPESRIAWFISSSCRPLIEHDADLDDIVLFDRKKLGRCWRSLDSAKALWELFGTLRKPRYDWVLDLQCLFRSGLFAAATRCPIRVGFADSRELSSFFYTRLVRVSLPHTVDRNIALARHVGIDARREDFSLQVLPEAAQQVDELLVARGLRPGRYLLCVPPTRWPSKRYPSRHWRKVVSDLVRDIPVVLMGSSDPLEKRLCHEVADGLPHGVFDMSGLTTVPQMVAMIAASAGVVCCDSSAKFIAPAVGVNVVALLGPTRVERTGPYLRGSSIVADVPCHGCLHRTCLHNTCMQMIAPEAVAAAARRMLTNRGE